ncbi:MAG TPA: response regulator transcription factor [Flavisolibacter sp.]|nr:response regulator transcription factor [Flavisolibacter sp.]
MIRILIIEDEIIIGRFIELQVQKNFKCNTSIAISVDEAREQITNFLPHLILCDINLEDQVSGIELVKELKESFYFEVIYITSYQSHQIISEAASTLPANYIIKPIDEAQLYAGVQLVISKVQSNENFGKKKIPIKNKLQDNEYRIVQLIAQRRTTKEIAEALNLSPHTIKNHRHNICRKLGLEDKNNALLRWAFQQSFL